MLLFFVWTLSLEFLEEFNGKDSRIFLKKRCGAFEICQSFDAALILIFKDFLVLKEILPSLSFI